MRAGASGTPAIELDCLSKRYVGGPLALDGVSLSVQPGEVFGLLGPNGAGKSTTIRILLDMARPTGGRAYVMGFDAQDDPVVAQRLLGYLPGNPKFYGKMTAVGPAILPGVSPTLPGGIAIPPGYSSHPDSPLRPGNPPIPA